jgi:hypothetical protein
MLPITSKNQWKTGSDDFEGHALQTNGRGRVVGREQVLEVGRRGRKDDSMRKDKF